MPPYAILEVQIRPDLEESIMIQLFAAATLAAATVLLPAAASAAETASGSGPACEIAGPQTPRDISSKEGTQPATWPLASGSDQMNLCNIHFHVNAEHKGPGFSIDAGQGEHGGFKCNETTKLTPAELKPDEAHEQGHGGHAGACHGVKPGDTIEVHWVFSSCAVAPGEGLGACSSPSCTNPTLRVESQVFLVVNDAASSEKALKFSDFDYSGKAAHGLHQPRALPATSKPVVFRGSTTGPKYSETVCSPLQATWSVRPECAKLSVASLHKWCADNVFKENHGHGVRLLVKSPARLDRIQ